MVAALFMVGFHLFIISTFPLAVPLEWNVVFAYTTDLPVPRLPELERIRPVEHVPALAGPGHRRRAAVLPGAGQPAAGQGVVPALDAAVRGQLGLGGVDVCARRRAKLNRVTRSAKNQIDQFVDFGYEPKWAEITLQKTIAWRTMHSQARGLFSLLLTHLPDIDSRTVREGEFVCNSLIGFNFGDGHLHNADMIRAVQREAAFEPGECVIAWVESEAFGSGVQHYKLIDAALGVIERGTWKVGRRGRRAALAAQRPDPDRGRPGRWRAQGHGEAGGDPRRGRPRSRSAGMSTRSRARVRIAA